MRTSKETLEGESEGGPGGNAEGNLEEAGSCQVSDTAKQSCMIRPESVY